MVGFNVMWARVGAAGIAAVASFVIAWWMPILVYPAVVASTARLGHPGVPRPGVGDEPFAYDRLFTAAKKLFLITSLGYAIGVAALFQWNFGGYFAWMFGALVAFVAVRGMAAALSGWLGYFI